MNEKQLQLAYNYYKANYSDWQDKAPTFDIFKGKQAHPFVKQLYEEATQNVTEQEQPQSFIEEAAKAMKSNVDTALVGVEKEQAMGTNPFNFPTQKPLEVVGGSEGGLIDNSRKPINEWYNQDIFNSETFTPPTEGQNEVFKPTLRDKEVSKVHKEAFTNTFRERGLIGAEEGIEDYITPEGKKYGFDAKGVYERPIETKEDYLQTMTGDNRNFDYRFTREGRYIPDLSKNNVNRKRAEGWEDMIEFAQKNKYPNKDFTQVRDMLLGDKELFNQTVAEYQGQTGGDAFAQAAQNKIVNQYNQNRLKKGSNLTEQENQAFEGNANALLSSPEEVKAFTDPFMGYEQPKRKDTNELLAKIEKPGVIGKVWNIGNAINSVLPVPTLETPKERINKLQNIAESPSTMYNGTNYYLLNKALDKAKKEGRELTELQYKALETLANGAGEGRDNGDFNDRQRVIDELIASLSTGEESEDFSALIAAKSPEYKVSKYDNEDKSWATERGFDAQDNGERQLAWQVRNSKSTMHQLLTQPSKEFTSKLNEVFKKAEEQGADLNKVAEQQAPKLAEFTTPQEKLNAYYNILLTRLEKIGGELGIDKNLDPANSGGKLDFKTAISALSFGENVAFNNKEIEYLSILNELKNLAPFMAKGLRPDEVDGGNAFTEFGNTFDEGLKGLLVPAAMQGSSSSGANKTLLKSLSDSGVLQSVAEQTVKGIEKRASDEMGLTTDYRSFEIPFIDITENGINPRLMGRTAGVLGGVGLTIAEQTLISRGLGIEGAIARTGGAFATLGTKLVSNEQKLAKAMPYLKYADNLIKTGVEYEVMGRVGDKSAEYRDEMNFGTGVAGAAFSNIFKGAMRKWIGTKVVGVNAAGDPLYKGIMKNGAGRYATNKIGGAIAENLEEIPQEIWQTYSKSGGDMQKTYKELFGDSGVFGSWNNALGFVFSIGMFGHLDGFNKEDVKGLMQLAADRAKKESPKEGETITPELIDEMAEGITQSAPAVTDIQRTEDGGVEFSSGQEVYHTSAEGVTTPVTDNGTVDMEKAEDVGKQLIQSVNDEGEREKTIESLSEKVDLNSPTQLNENLQSLRSKVDVNDLGVHDAIGTWVSYNAVGSNNIILVNVKNRIIKFKDAEGVNIESPLTEGEAAELMNMSSMLVSMRSKYLEKHGLSDEEEDEIDYYIHEKVAIKKATRKNQEQAENKQQIVSPINEQANETTSENGQTEQPEPTGVVTLTGEVDTAKSTDKKPVDDSNNGGANKQPIKTPKTVAHAGKDITEGEHIDSPRRIIISSLLKGLRLNTDDFRKALEGKVKKVSNIGQFLFKFGSPNSKLSTGKDKENTAVSLPKQLWDNLTDQEREKYDEADFTEAWDRVLDEFNGEPQEVINSWKAELEEGRKTSERMKDNEGNATGEEESTNERRKQFSNKRKSKGVVVKPKEEDAEIPQLLEQEKWREQMEKEVADEYEREQLAQIDNETQEVSKVDEILLQLEKGDKETLSELERIIDSNTNEKGEVDYEGVQRGLFGEGVSEEFKQQANKIIEKHERAITERIKQKQSGKPNENEKETDSKGDSTDVDKSGEEERVATKPIPTEEDKAFREYEKAQGGDYNLERRFWGKIKLWLKKIHSKINNFGDGYAKFAKEHINILDDGFVTPREWETKDKVVYVNRKGMKYLPNIYHIYYNGNLVFQTTEYYTALIYTLDYLLGNEIPTASNPNGLIFGEIKGGEEVNDQSKEVPPKAQSEQRPSSPQIALAQRIMDFFIKKFGIDVFAPMSEFYTKLEELGYSTLNQAAADGQEVVKSPKGKIYGFTYGGKIYLNPEFVTGETVFHELTHIQQEVIKQAAKKGDVKAKNILAKFNHLLDTYLKQIEKGAKVVKIGGKEINLSSSIYRKQQDETAADYRDRMADELWAYLQAPENLAKFDKGIVRQFIDAVADFFRKVLGIEKKVKDIQSMNLRELIGLTSDMLAKGEYLKAVKESNANSFMAEAEEAVTQDIERFVNALNIQGLGQIKLTETPRFMAEGESDLTFSEKRNLYKKAFGEQVSRIISGVMPVAFDKEKALIPYLKRTIPILSSMPFILKEMGQQIEKNFLSEEEEIVVDSNSPFDLMRDAGYLAVHTKSEDEVLQFRTYYDGGNGRVGGSIICTYNDVSGRLANNHIIFITKADAADTVRAEDLTQENINGSWAEYLEKIGRKNEDGTYNLKGLKNRREDPFGVSVLSIQLSKRGGSHKIINRYNHTINEGNTNPDATYGNNLNGISEGLSSSLYEYFNLEKVAREEYIPDGIVKNNGQLFKYGAEEEGVYYGEGFYIKDGVTTILDKNMEKMGSGMVFNTKGGITDITVFWGRELEKKLGGAKVSFPSSNRIKLSGELGVIEFEVENGVINNIFGGQNDIRNYVLKFIQFGKVTENTYGSYTTIAGDKVEGYKILQSTKWSNLFLPFIKDEVIMIDEVDTNLIQSLNNLIEVGNITISTENAKFPKLERANGVLISAANVNLSSLKTANMVVIYAPNADLSGIKTAGEITIYDNATNANLSGLETVEREVYINAANANLSSLKTAGRVTIKAKNADLSSLETEEEEVYINAENVNLSSLKTVGGKPYNGVRFMAEGEEEAPTKSEEKMALELAKELLTTRFEELAAELGFPPKWEVMTDEERVELRDAISNNLQVYFPTHDWGRYDEETAMRIFDEVYSETGSESKAEEAAMGYLESFKLEGGISEMAAQRIAEETIDNFDKENAELIKNRRKEVKEVSGSKNKDTHRFYENVLKRVANLPEFAAAFVEKNKDIFQYVTANVEDIKRAAISLLMDYSVEAAVEIQRELEVSTEEGFNSMLGRDRMLGYKIEVRALQKIANKANKIANNELAVTLQEVILQTTATIIGLRRLMELEHELKGIAGNTNDSRQAQAQTLLKELSADETIPLYGQVMHDLAKIGWHQGVSIRMFALWSAVSKDALDRMLDAVEVEEMKKMKGKQKEAAKVIRDLRKQIADIQKNIAENMTVEEVDKALFDAENKELMDKLTQLFDKAAENMRENDKNKSSTKSRTSTNTNQHAGTETAEQKSSRVKRAATRGANILKNLFSSGQWQLGDTDTTTDIGKVQEAIAALQKAFPRVRIIFDQNVWDSEVGNANARGFIKRKEGRTYVYLNPSKVNLNTPYHELAHVVLDVFERENVALFNEAMRMIKGTKYYTDAVELYGEGITARREAFVEMVADKGVELAEKNKKLFNRIWAEIKDLFNKFLGGGVDLFKSKPMDRVTLNDIVKAAAVKLQTGVEGDYMGAEAFSADVERQKAINSFIPLLDTIVGDNVVEAMDLDVLAEDLIYAINNLTNIGLSINDTKAIAFAKDVIAEYQKRTSIEIRLREEALEQYGKAQEIGGSSKGKTKNPDILARRLLLKSLADIAKERLKDDIAKDIEQAEEAAKAGQPYTSRYSQDAHKLYALVATGDFTQVEIKALEKALGLYEKDPNAWDRAFSLVDEMAEKYANENGFTPEQREALATSIEELLYKEGLRRANITTGEIDEAKERLLTPIAIAKLRERIQGLSRKGKTEGDELAAQAKVIARREIAESIRDLMGKTPEQVQKFKDTFKESLLDAGLSPKLAEEIASVASKLIDDNIKMGRGKELRTLLKNAPEETEKRTKAERGRKDIKLWNRVMSGANEATMYENISFMSDSWTEEQIDKFAAAYGIPNFSSPIIRQRIKELAIAMERTPMGWARIRASHDLMKYIGAKLYPIGGLGHITKRYWHFYYAGMLQNLPTHLVNFLMSLYRVLEDITSRLLRIGYNKLAKNERGEEAAKIGLQAYKNDFFTAVSVALSVFRGFEQMNEQKIENLEKGEQISSRYSLERESDYSSEGYDTGEKYLGVNVETGKWGIFEEILEGIKQFTSTKGEGAKGVIFSWVKLPFRALFAMDTFFRVLYTNSYALEASYNVERNNGNVEAYDTVLNKLYGESINEYENLAAQVALNAVKEGNANPQQEEIARLYNDILSQLSRGSVNIKDILNLERKQGYFLDKRGEASLSNERAREYEMRKSNLNKEYATAFFADQFASKMLLSETPTGIARFVYNIMNVATKIPLIGRMLFLFTKVPLNLANLWIDYSPFGIIRDLRDIFGLEGVSLLSYMSEATGVETDPTSAIAMAAANLQRFQDEKERLEDKRDLLLEQVQKQSGVQQRITENAIKNIEKDIVEAQRRILAAQANYQMATERVYRKLLGFAVSSLFLPLAYIFGGYEDDEEKRKAKRKRFLIELQGAFPNGDVKRQKERRTAWAKNAMRIWLGGKHIDIPMQFSPSNLNYVFLANYLEERHRRNKEGKKSTPFESAKHALYQSLTELSNASGFLSGNKLLASYLSGETSAWGGFIEELSLMGANMVGVPIKGALGIPEEVAGLIQAAFITDANKVIVGQYSNFFNKNIAYKKNYDAPIGARLAGYLMKAVGFNDVVNPSRTVLVSTVTGQKVKMTKGEDRLGITDLTGMLVETSRDELANDEVMMYLIGSGLIDNIPSKVDLKDLKGKDLPPNVQVAYIEDYGQKAYKRLQAFFQNKGGFEAGYLSGKYDKEGKPMKKRIKGKIALTEYKAKEWEDFAQNNLAETYELYKEGKIDKYQMQYLSYAKIISSIYMQERKAAKEELEEKLKLGTLNDPTIIEEEN